MRYIRNRKQRFMISILVAGLAALLSVSYPGSLNDAPHLAWWGTLYPQFCFSKMEELKGEEKSCWEFQGNPVKISFWLAKALDW